ncbi:DUF1570 domain-containing protein [soil metagenome]
MGYSLKAIGLAVAMIASALPAIANAEWRRAESERFVVYSDGDERVLRDYVQKLETYDRVLRILMRLPVEDAPPRKLPIYLVGTHRGLEAVWKGVPEEVAGFYTPGSTDIFAVALRQRDNDEILLHEYAHHFMLQHFPFGYPAWFVEGFAEYFATADIRPGRVTVGLPNENAANWLAYGDGWVPMSDLLSKRYWEVSRSRETYYPVSWLLTHWFLSDTARNGQLTAYLREVGSGVAPLEAVQHATGQTPQQLERILKSYLQGQARATIVTHPFPRVPIEMTVLPASADALLLLNQRLKRGIAVEDQPEVLERIQRVAANFPDDAFTQRVLARAELDFGDKAKGENVLTAVLERDPGDVEALQLMARRRMDQAEESDEFAASERSMRQARAFLAQAYGADDANFVTFSLLAEARRTAPGYPNDNDLDTLRLAYELAPQLPGARLNLANALIFKDRKDEAVALLQPLVNDPHNASIASIAQAMVRRARGEPDDQDEDQPVAVDETGSEPAASDAKI